EIRYAREEGKSCIARYHVDVRREVRSREPPRDRVLAPAAAEDQAVDPHTAARSLLGDRLPMLLAELEDPRVREHSHAVAAPPSLPLNRRRGLRRDVVHDAVHFGDLIDDARGDAREDVVRDARPVGGHEVLGRHRAKRHERAVRAVVTHHTDAADGREHRERLRHAAIEIGGAQLLEEDRVRAPEHVERMAIDGTDDADGEPRTGERMPPEDVLGDPELGANAPNLVLEEPSQRLDDLEVHDVRQSADVVMRLDARPRLRLAAARLDDVGVDRSLHEEIDRADPLRLLLADTDALLTDHRALGLRIDDIFEPREESLGRVDVDEAKARAERRDHLLGLALAQQSVIDEHAGEPIADRLRDERRRDRRIDAAGQRADRVTIADRSAQLLDSLLDERRGGPVPRAAADAVEEIAQDLRAARRVHDLRVELHGKPRPAV